MAKDRAAAEAAQKAKIDEHIAKVVSEAPPLTAEQKDRIALLLRR